MRSNGKGWVKSKMELMIGKKKVGPGRPVFIIAEAGVNHNGSLKEAFRLVEAAKAAGADAVKFQTYRTEELVTADAPKAAYQQKNTRAGSQFEMLKRLELSEADFKKLFDHCRQRKILFLSSPFDGPSAVFLDRLGVAAFKISSSELTNHLLLAQVAGCGKPVILSTGMASLAEVRSAVKVIFSAGNRKLILLHCTSNYPTAAGDVNLRAMKTLADEFALPAGFSDHTEGIAVSIAAAALGAAVLEKHFTLDKKAAGPDHQASLDPVELGALVRAVRQVEAALGDGRKRPTVSELPVRAVARKSIVAAADLEPGTKLSTALLKLKRPGTGLAPELLPKLVGRIAKAAIAKDEMITWRKVAR